MEKNAFLSQIHEALKSELPGKNAHQLMSPFGRPLDFDLITDIDSYKKSSVAVIFYQSNTTIEFVLIQRPEYEGMHGGQISFPGGKQDFSDIDEEYTARRETMEEIGIILKDTSLIGCISEVFIPTSKFIVRPYLYWLDEVPIFNPDPREVAEIVSVPLANLLLDQNVKQTSLRLGSGVTVKDVPYFDLNSKIVWGATAFILSEMKELMNLKI